MPEATLEATADHGDITGDTVTGSYDAGPRRPRRRREARDLVRRGRAAAGGRGRREVRGVLERPAERRTEGGARAPRAASEAENAVAGTGPRSNPLRDPRDRRLPAYRGPVRPGHLRRHRRPVPQEADARRLRPRQPRPAAAGLLPGRVRPPGLGGRGLRPGGARRGQASTPAPSSARRSGSSSPRACASSRATSTTTTAFEQLRSTVDELDAARGTGGNFAFYLSVPPKFFPKVVQQLKKHGLARRAGGLLAARGHREAVRPRPGERRGAQRGRARGLRPGPGLPHRPLPGQGDRPEHPGAALRQPDVRADLEPVLRRPRADHDGRGHRHRRPGRLLRRHRRRP